MQKNKNKKSNDLLNYNDDTPRIVQQSVSYNFGGALEVKSLNEGIYSVKDRGSPVVVVFPILSLSPRETSSYIYTHMPMRNISIFHTCVCVCIKGSYVRRERECVKSRERERGLLHSRPVNFHFSIFRPGGI